jgi:hypothetical protein
MSAPVLIVEERLRVVLVYLDAIRNLALLVDEPVHVPQFETSQAFAKWVAHMASVTAAQVRAVREVLPPSCTNLDAPFVPGGAR